MPKILKGRVYHGCQTNFVVQSKVLANQEDLNPEVNGRKVRMIQWMCGYIRLDRIRNMVIKEKAELAPI